MDWIGFSVSRDHWQDVVSTVMNLPFS